MKILIINHSPLIGSGSGIYTMNIAKALKRKKQEVRVITAANSLEFPNMEGIDIHPIFFENGYTAENIINFNVPCFDQYPTSDVVFYNLTKKQKEVYIEEFRKVLEQEINDFNQGVKRVWLEKLKSQFIPSFRSGKFRRDFSPHFWSPSAPW